MNILLLTSRLPYPPHRGDKLKIYNLIRQLSAAGHRITLLSFIASRSELEYVPALRNHCEKIITVFLPPWRSWLNCLAVLFSSTPFQVAYFASEEMRETVREVLNRKAHDVVHVHLIRMAQYAPEKNRSVARVLDLTDAGSLYLKRFLATTTSMVKKIFLRKELNRLSRYERVLERFDVSLVCSDIDRTALLSHAPSARIDLLYNGIDLEYFTAGGPAEGEPKRIICTGNMAYFPNEDGILYFVREILPLIRERIPDISLDIVGQKPTGKVRRLAGEKIAVTGFVPDIKEYYLKSAVAIAPIRFGAGTLNKILEPMALGIPVVTTSIGAEGLPVRSGCDLLIADSPKDFADAVVRLLNEEPFRKSVAQSGQVLVRERYDWAIIARRLEEIYRLLAKEIREG